MNVTLAMQIFQSFKRLFQNSGDHGLLKTILKSGLHDVKTRATRHEGHYHPHTLIHNKGAVRLHKVWMVGQAHGHCLSTYIILHTINPQINQQKEIKKIKN